MRVLAVDLGFGSAFVVTFDVRGVRILTVRLTIAVATITRVAVGTGYRVQGTAVASQEWP